MSGYPVPAAATEVELRFKNSRFIGAAGRAETVEEAREFIDRVRRQYPDASHHVYAFAAGYGSTVVHGMSDAGEPSGTAGRPVLAVVQGAGLGDVVVVVTRYFGGTKLGTGGLVRAYTQTAQEVLAATPRQEKIRAAWFGVALSYGQYAGCRKIVEELGGTIEAETFGAAIEVRGWIGEQEFARLQKALQEATAGQVTLERAPCG